MLKSKDTTNVSNHIHTMLADFQYLQQNLRTLVHGVCRLISLIETSRRKGEGFMLFQESRRGIIRRKRVRWKQEQNKRLFELASWREGGHLPWVTYDLHLRRLLQALTDPQSYLTYIFLLCQSISKVQVQGEDYLVTLRFGLHCFGTAY